MTIAPVSRVARPSAEMGRRIVLGIVIAMLTVSVLTSLLVILVRGEARVGTPIARIFLEYSLGVQLYRGRAWARWLAVGLMTLATGLLTYLQFERGLHGLMLALAGVFGGSALLLTFHPAVRAHFAARGA